VSFEMIFMARELTRMPRIHEFNIEPVMSLFLPYHESPHFAKMVTLLQLKFVYDLYSLFTELELILFEGQILHGVS